MSKVHSPQYALWLVPLFVLLSVRAIWYWFFVAGNVVLYAAIFAAPAWSETARDVLIPGSVWVRTATFLALVVLFVRADDVTRRVHGLRAERGRAIALTD